jgi:peptidoglycan/LPS O-acetylase OafA/YrhL
MQALPSKPHFEILDGLRGVAAIVVVLFHIGEAYSDPLDPSSKLFFNHGYLAVDFFFVLSGFVMGYAYDDRWKNGRMTLASFFKRRLIRLHPMVVFGVLFGAMTFYFCASPTFPLVAETPVWKVLLYVILGMLLIPTSPSMDIRGWQETYTFNGPCWTLILEYIANVLYALVIRRFPKWALGLLVGRAACATIHLTLTNGDVSGGWTLDAYHQHIGFVRLVYPFFAGLLLYRVGKLGSVPKAFLWCSLLVIVLLALPRGGCYDDLAGTKWMNGIYEALVIIVLFPLIVWMGASGKIKSRMGAKLCKWLGDISYPIYLINYPIIYVWTAYITKNEYSFAQSWVVAVAVFVITVALSFAVVRWYDVPVRKWLKKKFNA